ncbi:WecB/TagA/CpsF family glycosyltransferase [Shewanella insulae]|uniref:WecB/TagA/CpsF family glycosyltransferase n=1 Tax=Shewanella insulae TaxID=2681496 RepID=UPI001EFDD540|nr:WecB/TagA/CpsF family glycosyltransferase [Shewanella insulae]MCG9737529.1 WecB/TagA/CpsF family glycosyltransferase [Shewanella insulae]
MNIDRNLDLLFEKLDDKVKLVTFVNPFSYYVLKDGPVEVVNEIDHFFADGIFLVKLNNILYPRDKISRYSFDFTSLAPIVFNYSIENKLKVAVIGGSSEEIVRAVEVISDKYPVLNISYFRNGFFSSEAEVDDAIKNMNEKGINIVLCGMGTPLQEVFLIKCKLSLTSMNYGFTCGGFLSQIALREDYFNPIMSKLHLRWLQRAIRHSYVRKRLIKDYPKFFYRFLIERFCHQPSR